MFLIGDIVRDVKLVILLLSLARVVLPVTLNRIVSQETAVKFTGWKIRRHFFADSVENDIF